MKKMCFLVVVFLLLAFALPALGETYKNTYPDSCSVLWAAVKGTLNIQDNYNVKNIDEEHLRADYQPKHSLHVDVSGVLLQRENHVTLVPRGNGCEMQVVSNYSGWGHNDQGDFKKRVDQSLAKQKGAKTAAPEKDAKQAVPPTPAQSAAQGEATAPAPQSK